MIPFEALRAANNARQREWDTGGKMDASYSGNEMAGEIGEALDACLDLIAVAAAGARVSNLVKKLERERIGMAGSRASVEDVADEIADVVICADLLAARYGIDLGPAVIRKFNATSLKVGLATRMVGEAR